MNYNSIEGNRYTASQTLPNNNTNQLLDVMLNNTVGDSISSWTDGVAGEQNTPFFGTYTNPGDLFVLGNNGGDDTSVYISEIIMFGSNKSDDRISIQDDINSVYTIY